MSVLSSFEVFLTISKINCRRKSPKSVIYNLNNLDIFDIDIDFKKDTHFSFQKHRKHIIFKKRYLHVANMQDLHI